MHLATLLSLVAAASAQTFSFGVGLGGSSDVIPAFDSQRSGSPSSSSSVNPFANSRGAGLSFEDFFASSRVGTSRQAPETPSRSSSRSTSTARATTTTPAPPRRTQPTPNPTITNRGAPVPAPVRETARATTEAIRDTSSSRRSSSSPDRGAPFDASRGSDSQASVAAQPDLSSRGRVQEAVVRDPITRPPSTTTEVIDVRDNLVGQSVCARGANGDACRQHLATTAMSCTTGFCKECQQCSSLTPDLWPRCCREHFLCCRPLARACQACDHPVLTPFCGAAFGRCN